MFERVVKLHQGAAKNGGGYLSGLRRTAGFGAIGLLLILGLAGCGSTKAYTGITVTQSAKVIQGIPSHQATDALHCGPACVCSVALYWTKSADIFELVTTPTFRKVDTSADDLCTAGTSAGLRSFALVGTMSELEAWIEKGRPVIVLLKRHRTYAPAWLSWLPFLGETLWLAENLIPTNHWVIICGVIEEDWFLVQDPAVGQYCIRRSAFEDEWKRRKNICVLLLKENRQSPAIGKSR